MKYIEDINIENKKVILRLDLNVTIKDGKILDDTKIISSIPTINYLLNKNCKILILSHLGKIKTEEDKIKNTLHPVCKLLSEHLKRNIIFISNQEDPDIPNILNDNEIVMLENTRYLDIPLKRESKCDMALAKFWASAGEIFINDAFATSHRKHASNYGISKYLPSAYGLLFKKELDGLSVITKENPLKPFTVIMGGAKVDDKVLLIKAMLKKCDYLIVGGGIANTLLKAKSFNIGKSIYSEAELETVKEIINSNYTKIIYPKDVVVLNNENTEIKNIDDVQDEDIIYDIGPTTIEYYKDYLLKSKTIFMNGTVGLYEDERFSNGTKSVLNILEKCEGKKIAGGGDALSSINKFGKSEAFDFMSTGGGATLEYISTNKIECFED